MNKKIFKYPIELAFVLIVIIILLLGLVISYHVKEDYDCPNRNLSDVKCARLTQSNDLGRTCYPHYNDYRERMFCSEGWIVHVDENSQGRINKFREPVKIV